MKVTFSTNSENAILRFPPKQQIIEHLRLHHLTCEDNYPYLTEKKIIETVAATFSRNKEFPMGLKNGVKVALYELQLGLPKNVLRIMTTRLILALFDCADGKDDYECYLLYPKPNQVVQNDRSSRFLAYSEPHQGLPKDNYLEKDD